MAPNCATVCHRREPWQPNSTWWSAAARCSTARAASRARPTSRSQDGRIAAIGRIAGAGREEIDAKGLAVTPGFVDIHTHYDGQATWDERFTPSSGMASPPW